MKFGYFCNPQDPGMKRPWLDVMNEARELAMFCDESGFDTFWLAEHHFNHQGVYLIPNTIILATDLAARTKRIRLGMGAAIITFWHPMRLAEDLAMLDQLSNGRLDLGVGRGNFGIEGLNLNPIADPRDPKNNQEIFAETVAILKAAFSEKLFSFKGKHYQFPAPGFTWDRHTVKDSEYIDPDTNELLKLSLVPRPLQQPLPPMWQAVDSATSIQFAAKNDMGIIMWRPPADMLRERFKLYQKAAASVGRKVPLGARCGVLRDTFVAETAREAREMAEKYVMPFLNYHNWRGPEIFLHANETYTPEQAAKLKKELDYDFVQRSVLCGSPEEVIEKLIELEEVANVEQVLFSSSWAGMPHELTMRSTRLIAEKVIPKMRSRSKAAA
jgi:alkanesulfonate monooxygenase SsuD/methylene tetrahydromethanopterin reductase-like flavin-dependent oxidoreductase (luciferase family)